MGFRSTPQPRKKMDKLDRPKMFSDLTEMQMLGGSFPLNHGV